jgi:hypothetical protein
VYEVVLVGECVIEAELEPVKVLTGNHVYVLTLVALRDALVPEQIEFETALAVTPDPLKLYLIITRPFPSCTPAVFT